MTHSGAERVRRLNFEAVRANGGGAAEPHARRMRIFSTPCETGPDARTHADATLRELHAASMPRLHELVDRPDDADVILISNLPLEPDQLALRRHPLFPRYLHKSFALWDAWNTPFLLPGVYANAARGTRLGRFRSGSYALLHPNFKNPFVEAFENAPPAGRAPDLLFSFLGRDCHPCRARLFKRRFRRRDVLVEDTSGFNTFTHDRAGKEEAQRRYLDIALRSKFVLCPRGVGPSSIRLFEALRLGIAPVIISDAWLPCAGPDWRRFAIFIPERDLNRVEEIVEAYEPRWREMGAAARRAHEEFFSRTAYFNFLVENVRSIARSRVVPERWLAATWPLQVNLHQRRARSADGRVWTTLPGIRTLRRRLRAVQHR